MSALFYCLKAVFCLTASFYRNNVQRLLSKNDSSGRHDKKLEKMKKYEHVKYWMQGAEEDLTAVESLFKAEKYNWSLFIAHLVVEKMLKALFVLRNDNTVPPKTHNLVKLAEKSFLELPEETRIFLDEVNSFNLEARYPDYKNEFHKKCDKEFAKMYLDKIKEHCKWLKSLIECEK